MKKRALIYLALAGSLALTACGSKETATETGAESVENVENTEEAQDETEKTEEESGETINGRVESVSDSELVVAAMQGGGMQGGAGGPGSGAGGPGGGNGGAGGERPSGDEDAAEGDGQADSDRKKEKPDGEKDGQPDGTGRPGGGEAGRREGRPGEGGQGENPSEGGGQSVGRPGGQPGDGNQPDGESDGEQSDHGEADGSRPDGGDGQDGDHTSAMPEAETVTVKLTADTEVVDGEGTALAISDIEEGDFVTIELASDGETAVKVTVGAMTQGGFGGGQGGPGGGGPTGGGQMGGGPGGGGQSAPDSYDAVITFDEDAEASGETYSSTGTDENAIHVSAGTVSLSDFTLTRESADSSGGDSSSFYGIGAAILASGGTLDISGATIATDAKGAAGIFAYADGVIHVSDTTITTEQGTSGGIHVAGGGTLSAENLTVETNGGSSAAIRSDRGGGTMTVDGGTYVTNGTGSPAVYVTADITVQNATLTANQSEAICIEGLNSLKLINCDLSGNIPENEQNDCDWTVILYQSMSGDSEVGNSTFDMEGGTLTSKNGGLFYTTNTESTFYLKQVAITPSQGNDFFLKVTGNANGRGWGSTGANGADCVFTAEDQEMVGDVIWDSISTLDFTMSGSSRLTGAFIQDESNAGNGGSGYANLALETGTSWIVTGDSTLTALVNAGTIEDESGKTVSILGTDGTVYVDGDSAFTITVDSYQKNE